MRNKMIDESDRMQFYIKLNAVKAPKKCLLEKS